MTVFGGGPVGAVGLQVEREVQELTNEFGRGLMLEAFEIANTTSSEVTSPADPRGGCWYAGRCPMGDQHGGGGGGPL
jgi:hypothetical protein